MRPRGQFVYIWSPIIGGVFLLFSEILLADSPRFVVISGASLGLIIVGIRRALMLWSIKRKRRFFALRDELDAFLLHARQLNDMARDARQETDQETDADYPQSMLDLKEAMHDSVERMAAVAGVPQAIGPALTPKPRDAHTAVT